MYAQPTTQAASIAQRAIAKGFTQPVFVSNGMNDLQGYVRLDDDLEGVFLMICGDTGDTLKVCGWQASEITFVDQLED